MIVLINGKEEPYAWGSIDLDDAIGQRSTASFAIVDKEANKRFKRGQNVLIYDSEGEENVLRGASLDRVYDWGDTTLTSTVDSQGKTQLKSTKTTETNFGFQTSYNQESKYTQGKTYTLSFLARGDITNFDYIYLMRGDGGNLQFPGASVNLSTTEFKKVVVRVTASFSTEKGYVLIGTRPVNGTWFEVKEVSIVEDWEPMEKWRVNPLDLPPVFGGVIARPVAKWVSLGNKALMHSVTCADWHYMADKRIIAKVYEETDAGVIVEDIITNYLAAEGIKAGNVQLGPQIVEAVFNYVRVSDAMDSLCEKAGFEWFIDADKYLHFFARSAFSAPVNITETSDIKNVDVEPAAEDYRNKQYIRAGKDITDPQTVQFAGDGKNKSFTFPYELALEPIVKVNGVAQTVGIRGLEDKQQWYWNKGDKVVSMDDQATPLTSSQTLEITGQGFFDIVVLSYDQTAIDEMQSVEGGTGVHEDVLDDPYLTSRAAAFESASAKLRRYARIGNKVSFDTKIRGLKAGQLININLPSFDINTDFLIESIKAAELGTDDGRLIYQVSAVDGAATGGWANFFKKMATRGQAYVIRENIQENEILITLAQFQKTWTLADNPNIFNPPYPSATLYPGATLYPAIIGAERSKYVSFFDSANKEIFRKTVTKVTDNGNSLTTTALILPFEANDLDIAYIGFWGGSHATATFGTGVLLDKQAYAKVKSDLESIQIEKIDYKGW